MSKRTVGVVLADRANYGRMEPVLRALDADERLDVTILATGTMVLERFARPVEIVRQAGFTIGTEIHMELEGSIPETMAKSIGIGVMEFASYFSRQRPDILLVIGDRYEALAAVIAAAYMNICIAHIQGGEVSGSIDESARHAITKFAHYHFPSTQRSADYIVKMGERPETILSIGCPSSDISATLDLKAPLDCINERGSGCTIDFSKPFFLSIYHPTTTSFGTECDEIHHLLSALEEQHCQTVLLWPNIDAGSNHISKQIRIFRDQRRPDWLRIITNLPPEDYLRALSLASCAIGNSSSFVRDSSYSGTPVVLVGQRQEGRETAENVVRCEPTLPAIREAIQKQKAHGRYAPSTLYGDGKVSQRIASALATAPIYSQKRLAYIHES